MTPRSHDQVAALLARVTYKPNVRMRLANAGSHFEAWLDVDVNVPDVNAPETMTTVRGRYPIPLLFNTTGELDERYALTCIRRILLSFEEHELDEWLMLDGKQVNPPHG